MNISWQYLDKRNATIGAIRDYESMKHILTHTVEEITPPSDQPGNPPSGEGEVDVLAARFQQAAEYMAWFQPGWEALSEEERFVLNQFYLCEENRQTDNIYEICDHFHIERSSAYKKKDRALAHLSLLLYGR